MEIDELEEVEIETKEKEVSRDYRDKSCKMGKEYKRNILNLLMRTERSRKKQKRLFESFLESYEIGLWDSIRFYEILMADLNNTDVQTGAMKLSRVLITNKTES